MKNFFLFLGVIGIAMSCNPKVNAVQDQKSTTGPQASQAPVDPELVKGNNQFAIDLYGYLKSDEENVFFSPFSISAAMAMTYAGARGESEKQIAKVMHFNTDLSKFNAEYAGLLAYVIGLNRTDSIEISTANAMFAQKDYAFSDEYFKMITDYYGAGLQNLDFKKETEQSRVTINQWVEAQTKEKIKELLVPGILSELTRLVLVNAIYFYGSWQQSFDPKQTQKMDFFVNPEKTINAEYMFREGSYPYMDGEKFQVVEIPYAGKSLSMMVILPRDHKDMPELESSLSADQLALWSTLMTEKKIRLRLPKFKMTDEFELSDVLKKMGMPHPFSLNADLSGMTGHKDLMIDKVVHKAFIDVSEKGTEAAAATAVVIREKNGMVIPELFASRPFIILIRDRQYGGILFVGKVNQPII